MIKVLVADDHEIVRIGLKSILEETGNIKVEDEASSGHELFDKLKKKSFDLIILDISMPGKGGIDVLKQIKSVYSKIPVLILSSHPEDQYAIRAIRAGASGYLTKDCISDNLVAAIRKILSKGKFISEALAEKLINEIDINHDKPLHQSLSDREYSVLCLIASGKSVSDIAKQMSLSVKTISTYRARILEKLNMKNNAEITHYAIFNKLALN